MSYIKILHDVFFEHAVNEPNTLKIQLCSKKSKHRFNTRFRVIHQNTTRCLKDFFKNN